jgi:hypothetical protein
MYCVRKQTGECDCLKVALSEDTILFTICSWTKGDLSQTRDNGITRTSAHPVIYTLHVAALLQSGSNLPSEVQGMGRIWTHCPASKDPKSPKMARNQFLWVVFQFGVLKNLLWLHVGLLQCIGNQLQKRFKSTLWSAGNGENLKKIAFSYDILIGCPKWTWTGFLSSVLVILCCASKKNKVTGSM